MAPLDRLVVRATDGGWSLVVEPMDRAAWTVSTKKKAVAAAVDAARELQAKLVIETRAGVVQRTRDFGAEATHGS